MNVAYAVIGGFLDRVQTFCVKDLINLHIGDEASTRVAGYM